ncbi:Sterol 3-beta-glucosyltransferase [Clydaea vesicula]|uniref:sterol 3beta-glucosyltransferase n=1 Tax=Clydaea vesicula TaxID=447962 RepID=A0AAD5TXM7_9FUNG|nr:Sterol 3-beta-glucosyltransferase [Clydaea vesicula]
MTDEKSAHMVANQDERIIGGHVISNPMLQVFQAALQGEENETELILLKGKLKDDTSSIHEIYSNTSKRKMSLSFSTSRSLEKIFDTKLNNKFEKKKFKVPAEGEEHNIKGKQSNMKKINSFELDVDDEFLDEEDDEVNELVDISKIHLYNDENLPLNEKIKFAFELPTIEEYQEEFACWLVRSVLLKGYIFLTEGHICFWAKISNQQERIHKSGFLKRRVGPRKQYWPYWFVLNENMISLYENSTTLYYPETTIQLSEAEIMPSSKAENVIILSTPKKKYYFLADTKILMEEWLKAITTAIFRARKEIDDDVRIVLPFSNITDIELIRTESFLETLRIKVVDDELLIAEEYYFAYFNKIESAYEAVHRLHQKALNKSNLSGKRSMYDSTMISTLPPKPVELESIAEKAARSSESNLPNKLLSPPEERKPHSHSLDDFFGFKDHRRIKSDLPDKELSPNFEAEKSLGKLKADENSEHAPIIAVSPITPMEKKLSWVWKPSHRKTISDTTNAPQPLKKSPFENLENSTPPLIKTPSNSSSPKVSHANTESISEKKSTWAYSSWVWTPTTKHKKLITEGQEISLPPTAVIELKKNNEDFRKLFTYSCYLRRTVLRLGKIYISENYVCFNSKVFGIKLKAVIPIQDILTVIKDKNTQIFYYGITIITKEQIQIYFEFHSFEICSKCYDVLLERLSLNDNFNNVNNNNSEVQINFPPAASSSGLGTNLNSISRSKRGSMQRILNSKPSILENLHLSDEHIKYSFDNGDFTSVGVGIPSPLHITCLTIGTRGDVQPYIALCKGLMKDGHRCRIATHLEYKSWIEGHDIEFGEVKGDPAELMQLCVEYGTFSVSFFRAAIGKLRGWVDELLLSAWQACQNTDLLIESPTAFGGLHIAERLEIPFFSAFPMPWTRTRNYPHPFAVPETTLGGGSYNYMSHVLIEQVLWKGAAIQINKWRKQYLDMPPTHLGNILDHKIPFLYSFSPSVVPPPPDWPDWIHTCGYWFLENPELEWKAPESLLKFLNDEEDKTPVVYIGFGSIVVPDPDEMTRCVIEAVQKAKVKAVLSKGWSSRGKIQEEKKAEIEYPSCMYPLDKVPHDWLFPKVAAVVHHGGAGTTAAGIRAGKPTVIKPFFGDQYFWADRISELGSGCFIKNLSVDKLANALILVTTESKIKEKAKLLGEKVKLEDGVSISIKYIYRDLDFSKSRVMDFKRFNNPTLNTPQALVPKVEEQSISAVQSLTSQNAQFSNKTSSKKLLTLKNSIPNLFRSSPTSSNQSLNVNDPNE